MAEDRAGPGVSPAESAELIGHAARRIVLTYVLFAALWILVSDNLLPIFWRDPTQIALAATLKGWAFVGVTALLLYGLIRRYGAGLAARATEARMVADTAGDAIWIVRADQRFLYANPAACQLTGYRLEELLAMTPADLLPAEARVELAPHLALLTTEEFIRREWPLRRRDGSVVGIDATTQRLPDGRYLAIGRDLTQQRQAQQQLETVLHDLREKERDLRLITTAIADVFWMATPDFSEIVFVSPSYEMLWGRSTESLYRSPHSWAEAIHPEDRPRIVAAFHQHLGAEVETEYRILRPDGSLRWIHDRGFPVYDEAGRLFRVAGIAVDITERKQMEASLSLALESARAGAWGMDMATGMVQWSRQTYPLFGFRPNTVPGVDSWLAAVLPEDSQLYQIAFDQAVARRQEVFWQTYRIRHPDKGLRWLTNRARITYSAHGAAERVSGINIDVTELVETRSALLAARQAVHALVDASPGPRATLGRDDSGQFTVEWANRPFAELIGRPVAELLGARFLNLLNDLDALASPTAIDATMGARFDLSIERPCGVTQVQMLVTPVQGVQEQAATLLVTAVDMTEERLSARREAERHLLTALGRMAGRIAHEVNNALQPIMSHATLARHACADNDQALGHIDEIQNGVRHGRDIVRSVLAAAGGQLSMREPRLLEQEVATALDLIRPTAPARISIATELEATGGCVSLAPSEVFQILSNLLKNAFDAIAGDGAIRIATGPCDVDLAQAAASGLVPGPYAQLIVSDTGGGMDTETLRRARDPFFTTKPVGGGAGLGLATVQALLGECGGGLDITSAPARGTSVRVRMPIRQPAARDTPPIAG